MTNIISSINSTQEELDLYEDLQPRNVRQCLNKARAIMSRKDKRGLSNTISNTKRAAKKFSFRNTRYTAEEY